MSFDSNGALKSLHYTFTFFESKNAFLMELLKHSLMLRKSTYFLHFITIKTNSDPNAIAPTVAATEIYSQVSSVKRQIVHHLL